MFPELSRLGRFYFIREFDHVLSGFFIEKTPRGAYLWKFVYPLFDDFEDLNLIYSQRLSGEQGYVDFDSGFDGDMAKLIGDRVKDIVESARGILTIPQFLSYCESYPGCLDNPLGLLNYGYGQILTGHYSEAGSNLAKALYKLPERRAQFCMYIMDLLKSNPGAAQEAVLSLEVRKRAELGLHA